jgi:hypothetical protein
LTFGERSQRKWYLNNLRLKVSDAVDRGMARQEVAHNSQALE